MDGRKLAIPYTKKAIVDSKHWNKATQLDFIMSKIHLRKK